MLTAYKHDENHRLCPVAFEEMEKGSWINCAAPDAAELEKLPGIGTVLAWRIAADREANGPFAAIGDIQRVAGIGEAKFDALKDYITVK